MIRYKLPYQSTLFGRQHTFQRSHVYEAWTIGTGAATFPIGLICAEYPGEAGSYPNFFPNTPELTGKVIAARNISTGGTNINSGRGGGSYSINPAVTLVGKGGTGRLYGVAPEATLATAVDGIQLAMGVSASAMAAGIDFLVASGARVIVTVHPTAPAGPTVTGSAVALAVANAWSAGCLVVSYIGDDETFIANPTATAYSPSDAPHVLCVGGVRIDDEARCVFSMLHPGSTYRGQYGPRVDILASQIHMGISAIHENGKFPFPGTVGFWNPNLINIASVVGGVAQLVWAKNPSLTNEQVRNILISTATRPKKGWKVDMFYNTAAGVGVVDAELAVLKAESTLPGNSNKVFPYLRLKGRGETHTDDWYNVAHNDIGIEDTHSEGLLHIKVRGTVSVDLGAFCSSDTVNQVELWLNGTRVYQGPPVSRWTDNAYQLTSWGDDYWQVRVVARTVGGLVGTRDYLADVDSQVGVVSNQHCIVVDGGTISLNAPLNPDTGLDIQTVNSLTRPLQLQLDATSPTGGQVEVLVNGVVVDTLTLPATP